jgi:hypothetical protein
MAASTWVRIKGGMPITTDSRLEIQAAKAIGGRQLRARLLRAR